MNKSEIIDQTIQFVKSTLQDAEGGHDWFHIERVWKNAKHISKNENVDLFIVELGALLHDIADAKFHNGDETVGPKKARSFLESIHINESIIQHIESIIINISFKNSLDSNSKKITSKELEVIQDADRLDAIGAIGIARTFNYGGFKNRELWQFKAVRQFKRSVAKTYPEQWPKYVVMESKKRVAHMYNKK